MDANTVDALDAEVVEVVSTPVDDSQAAEPTTTSAAQEPGRSDLAVTLRDLGGAVNETRSDLDAMGAQVHDGFAGVSEGLRVLSKGQDTLSRQLNETTGGEQDGNYTVTIDAAQWSEMRDCWLWVKDCAGLTLFLVLVVSLFVAAIFGSRLWSDFSKGWRR